jgi:glutathione S-transferase
MLKLFYAPGSCARASHIALREAAAEFELRYVDFAAAEQRTPEYRKLNPKGRVPALQTERGVITETPAILAYIAQTHPQAGLAPLDDPFEFARMQSFASYLCATVHVAHAHSRRGERWADDPGAIAEMKRKAPQVMAECFQLIEDEFFVGPWVLGEAYSVVDPYLFTVSEWLQFHKIDSARYPKVHGHLQRMLERPAVRAALDAESAR